MTATLKALLAHEGDTLVRAGAGTGKTWTLVELMVGLVAGRGPSGQPIAPARILALTFSEKAAAELRERIRARFDELARAPEGSGLTDQGAFGPALGEASRASRAAWRDAAAACGTAPISTFHGFAARLLRRHAAAAGLDPGFVVLEEAEAVALARTAAEEVLLARASDPEIASLLVEHGFNGSGGFASGLVDRVLWLEGRLREDDRDPQTIPIDDEAALRAAWPGALAAVPAALRGLATLEPTTPARKQLAAEAAGLAVTLGPELAALAPGDDPATLAGVAEARLMPRRVRGEGAPLAAALRESLEELTEVATGLRALPIERALRDVAVALRAAARKARADRRAVDFADLISRARGLLATDEAVRTETQARFDAIVVDEYQDTNRLQDALVRLVQRPGVPCAHVGDPKQSIYEFRGADVTVFAGTAARVALTEGLVPPLDTSRRSTRPLVEAQNRLFARVLAPRPGSEAFEVGFDAADALAAVRDGEGPALELLPVPEDGDEPRLVAARLAELHAGGRRWGELAVLLRRFTHLDDFLAALRAEEVPYYVVNGRGFHEAQEIRDLAGALALLDDPDDAHALIGVLRSPLVGLSDATLLAIAAGEGEGDGGEEGGVDAGRRRLRLDRGHVRRAAAGRSDGTPDGIPEDERVRLAAWLALETRLRRHADRLGAGGLLRALVEETDLAAVLATTFHGEQRVANLERLVELARVHDEGTGGRGAFARRLAADARAEESRATPAQLLGERDDVVRVMTIHQSKGLEFPVVVVAETHVPERVGSGFVVYDDANGLGLRLKNATGALCPTPVARRAGERIEARQRAESLRLFYVAATRARDLLVLSGKQTKDAKEATDGKGGDAKGKRAKAAPPERDPSTWWEHARAWFAGDPEADRLARDVHPVSPPRGPRRPPPADTLLAPPVTASASTGRGRPSTAARARAAAAAPAGPDLETSAWIRQACGAPAVGAATLVAPVTELADLAACPRRYHLRHEVGLDEHPAPPRRPRPVGDALSEAAPGLDARERGTLVHAVLERADLAAGLAGLDAAAAALGHDPALPATQTLLAPARAFLATPFGAKLGVLPAGAVRRELSFAFRPSGRGAGGGGGPALLVKGQMDLVVVDPEGVTVIDYKLARSSEEPRYAFQLAVYAAAARAMWQRPVRVGLAFLLDANPAPRLFALAPAALDAAEDQLAGLGRTLAGARRVGHWDGQPIATCEAIGCGFVARCHGRVGTGGA